MKTKQIYSTLLAIATILMVVSCTTPVTMTTYKNPNDNSKISKVVVMPLFDKIENIKPFEQSVNAYFNSKGLKSIGSLDFLAPAVKYPIADIKRKCDSLGADAILVVIYQGTDKTESYVPQTTYVSGGFGGYWGGGYWGGGYYGSPYYAGVVSTGGYWTATHVVNLKASVYTHASKEPLWTAEIKVTDPKYVDEAAMNIARNVYSSWESSGLLKSQK
ncbi:MAG: hypothetical protein WCO44_08100 [Bacteroidota bacterium]